MRLLLDESVPVRLRRSLPRHSVKIIVEMGWGGVNNGALLALAAKEFDAFLTVDKKLPYQQNLANLPIAIIVLEAYQRTRRTPATRSQPGASTWQSAALYSYAGWGITRHGENKEEAF
jgi:hypothetical protein